MSKRIKSREAMARARAVIPGGVNSPVRAFGSVGGDPVFFERGQGAYLYDIDGSRYIDFIGSWGPAIAGHAHPEVLEAIAKVAAKGLSFGAPTEAETVLAETVRHAFPSMEKVRFVSSGTEACMSVLRVARAYTKRDKILKFTGCYHGHADMLLVKAGSGALTLGLPDSPGVPEGATSHTLLATYNDLDAVREVFAQNREQIAAVIVEPIVGNAGFIRPVEGFLEGLRQITQEDGALLIFDEVMTGFRVSFGGVQELKGIKPDLTTLGKVIGGGLPIGAYGGRKDIMAMVAPEGPVYQAGTLSGNPVAVASGLKTLEIISRPGAFARLAEVTRQLANGLRQVADKHGIPFYSDCEGGMFGYFFHKGPVHSLEEAKKGDSTLFKKFFWGMLDEGIYLAPSAYEAGFVSMAHTPKDVDATLAAAERVLTSLT